MVDHKTDEMSEKVLAELKETYLQLLPSKLHGIGVFAIRDIPKGCRTMFTKDKGEWIPIPKTEVKELAPYLQRLVDNYCTHDQEYYYIEKTGFKKMDLANFVNHSDNPNIIPINDGEYFEAISDIKEGEEILINYANVASD